MAECLTGHAGICFSQARDGPHDLQRCPPGQPASDPRRLGFEKPRPAAISARVGGIPSFDETSNPIQNLALARRRGRATLSRARCRARMDGVNEAIEYPMIYGTRIIYGTDRVKKAMHRADVSRPHRFALCSIPTPSVMPKRTTHAAYLVANIESPIPRVTRNTGNALPRPSSPTADVSCPRGTLMCRGQLDPRRLDHRVSEHVRSSLYDSPEYRPLIELRNRFAR